MCVSSIVKCRLLLARPLMFVGSSAKPKWSDREAPLFWGQVRRDTRETKAGRENNDTIITQHLYFFIQMHANLVL